MIPIPRDCQRRASEEGPGNPCDLESIKDGPLTSWIGRHDPTLDLQRQRVHEYQLKR